MNLNHLKDNELLLNTQQLVENERHLLTKILHHLREVERRKLFSDLGYQSLFEYAVKELKYSEGQAGRRIQAMRLLKELPQLEEKIEKGTLSLSNISQAQSFFREQNKSSSSEKLNILQSLENKSAREGQKILTKLNPDVILPKEKERILTESHSEMRFILTEELKRQLNEVRSLIGIKGVNMSLAELIDYMSQLSIESLKTKKFGKKRALPTPTSESQSKNIRYIPKKVKQDVWTESQYQCQICNSQHNLQIDHIKPIALGGKSNRENLRLLCFNCNQRQSIKEFGIINYKNSTKV